MQHHVRKIVLRAREQPLRTRPALRTLILLLPRFRNPDATGLRRKIELHTWKTTLREVKTFFSGYQAFRVRGWNREDNVRDDLYRFEVDLPVTRVEAALLRQWERTLALRFEQRAIYIKMSDMVTWL